MVGCHAEGGTSGCGNVGRHTDTAERLDRGTRPDTETWPDIGTHLDMGAHLDTGVHPDTRTHPLSTTPIPSPPHGTPCAPQPLTQTCYFPAPAKKKGKATKSPISTHPPQEGLLMSPPSPLPHQTQAGDGGQRPTRCSTFTSPSRSAPKAPHRECAPQTSAVPDGGGGHSHVWGAPGGPRCPHTSHPPTAGRRESHEPRNEEML